MISRDKLKNYIKTLGLYFSASIIPMVLNLAVNPFIALNMSPVDYAISGYYVSFNTLFMPIITYFLMHYYMKSYYTIGEQERLILKAMIFKSLIFFSAILSVVCCITFICYTKLFNQSTEIPLMPYVLLSFFSIPLTGIYALILTDLRISRNGKRFFYITVSYGIISVLIILFFVVFLKWGAFGKLLSTFVLNFIFFIWSCWYNRSLFKIKFDIKQFIDIIKFCTPLTFAAMLGFFYNGYDRAVLERLGNYEEFGYYVVAVQMAGYINVFSTALSSTFQPDFYESISKKDFRRTFSLSLLMIVCVSVIVLFYILFAPLVVDLLTAGRYIQSVKYTQIIALSTITSTMYYSLSQTTIALGKTKIILFVKTTSTVLTIMMFAILIDKFGFIGAAWGIVFSFLILCMLNSVCLFSNWNYKKK